MKHISALLLGAVLAYGQTQVNLRNQSKNVDFGSASSTRPAKTGSVLPSACQIGDMYFKSNEPAGFNLYGCATTNTWSVLSGGQGAGSQVSFCNDQGVINAYACIPVPAISSYQAGQFIQFRANSTNTGPVTVNFSSLGTRVIKKHGDHDLQARDIKTGQVVTVVYDGTDFQMQSHLANFLQAGGSGVISLNRNVFPWTIDIETSLICMVSASCAPTGTFNLSNSSMTKPSRHSASDPVSCSEGESYYNTTLHKRRNCTAADTWTDEAADQAGPVFTAGQGWYLPLGSGVADGAVLDPTPHYFQIVIPHPVEVARIAGKANTAAQAGAALAVALYYANGTRVTNAFGNTVAPAVGPWVAAFPASVKLPAGVYYLGIASEDATLSVRVTDLNAAILNAGGAVRAATGNQPTTGTGSSFTLPETIGTLSPSNAGVPAVYMLP